MKGGGGSNWSDVMPSLQLLLGAGGTSFRASPVVSSESSRTVILTLKMAEIDSRERTNYCSK